MGRSILCLKCWKLKLYEWRVRSILVRLYGDNPTECVQALSKSKEIALTLFNYKGKIGWHKHGIVVYDVKGGTVASFPPDEDNVA